jgi:hypothetical protein
MKKTMILTLHRIPGCSDLRAENELGTVGVLTLFGNAAACRLLSDDAGQPVSVELVTERTGCRQPLFLRVYSLLPREFTAATIDALRGGLGFRTPAHSLINKLKAHGLAEKTDAHTFRKTEPENNKNFKPLKNQKQ